MKAWMKTVAVLCLMGMSAAASAQNTYTLPFVLPADTGGMESFLRFINRDARAATVQIHAIDSTGRNFGPVTISISPGAVVHFTSRDLERGNASKGLPVGIGDGVGDWRLVLSSAFNIQPLSYIRTSDGFVTAMHDVAPSTARNSEVVFFNPGRNTRQRSFLYLANPGTTPANVTIAGRDDAGRTAIFGSIRLTLPAGNSRRYSAYQLELGAANQGGDFEGRLGPGTGKWRLTITSNADIQVMSLLFSPTGHLTNMSTSPVYTGGSVTPPPPEPPPPNDDHGNTFRTATRVSVNSTTPGRIERASDSDFFRFELPRTGRLQVQSTGNTDTSGVLFRGTAYVTSNNNDGSGTNFRITVPEAQAGTWYVRVLGSRDSTTGPYSLRVEFSGETTPPPPPEPPPPTTRQIIYGVVDVCNDGRRVEYRFFEQNSSSRTTTGRHWPGGDRFYYTPGYNREVTSVLSCSVGTGACLGARINGIDNRYWGVGFDGNKGCVSCCHDCPSSARNPVRFTWRIGCPSRSSQQQAIDRDALGNPARPQ